MLTENKIFTQDIEYITSTITENLSNKKVLVTGACGMIGTMLSISLINAGAVVYGLDISRSRAEERFSNYINDGKFVFICADITEPLNFDFDVDYIIHAASNAYPKSFEVDPVGTMLQNFMGIKTLLDYSLTKKARLIYISTGEVYGQYSGESFKENSYGYVDILSPRSCYPSSKRASETLLASYVKQYDAKALIVRLSHVYGLTATAADTRASTAFIRNGVAGEDIVMKSKGEQIRSYTYIADCVAAILYVLFNGNVGEACISQTATFCVCGVICSGLFFLIQDFITLWLGSDMLLDTRTVVAITLYLYYQIVMRPVWMFREGAGMYNKIKYVMLVTAVTNIILSIIFGKLIGLSGILFATTIANITTCFWYEPKLLFKDVFSISPWVYYRDHFINAAVTLFGMLLCYLAIRNITEINVFTFIIKGVICVSIMGAVYLLRYFKTPEFAIVKNKALKKVKGLVSK